MIISFRGCTAASTLESKAYDK